MKRLLFAAMLGLLPSAAFAHEVLHSIERGRAVAVKAYFADGEAMAYAEYQVFSPADAKIPWQKGRSDRGGYVAFVPDAPGDWHVRVADGAGHGLDVDVPVPPPGRDAGKAPAAGQIPTWAFLARPLMGAALIAAVFGFVAWLYRRKGRAQ